MRGASSVDADDASAAPRSLPGRGRDLSRAKLSASLKWLLCKAYDGCVPLDFKEPLPTEQEDTVAAVHMNLGVRSLLVNSKLYCAACERLFGAAWNTTFNGHWSVIQSLARRGFYVAVDDGTAISEADLSAVQPFNTSAHLAVIDTMMAAHVAETAPVVRVVQAIRSVTSFNASKDLPCSSEDALLLWMNKIWALTAEARHKASQLLVLQSAPPTVRLNKNQLAPCEPEQALGLCAENVVETLRDGRCIAATISFYFPQQIKMEDVCLASTGSIHDATRNWQLIGAACSTLHGLATGVHFAAADLYDDRQCRAMKSNILSLVSEVFCACAAVRGSPPSAALATSTATVPLAAGKSAAIPPSSVVAGSSQTLISEATKRSFISGQQRSASAAGASAAAAAVPVEQRLAAAAAAGSSTSRSDGSPAAAPASPSVKQPLLTKRHKELTSTAGQTTKASFCAWEDKNGSDAADRLTSSEPSVASGAQALACSSRWGVYPFNSDRCSPIEDAERFAALPDSARTYTLPSKTLPADAAACAAASAAPGPSVRHAASSPATTVGSMCDSAAAADQECARILMGGAAAVRPPDPASVVAGEVRASANDVETPVTARSLVSNTMLWCDDDDDVTVSLDSEATGGGGFYLRRGVLGDSVASGAGNCGTSLAWSPLPSSVKPSSAKELDNGRVVAVPDEVPQTSEEEESCSARGVSRTTSFAELKHFIATPANMQPAASGDGASPRDDIRSPSAASNSSGSGTMGSGALLSLKTEFIKAKSSQSGAKSPKKTTFAMKQTTWAENAAKLKSTGGLPSALVAPTPSDRTGSMEASVTSNSSSGGGSSGGGGSLTCSSVGGDLVLASESAAATARQHADVRLLLSERRRAIEAGRQAAGAARGEQRDEISREAFLQAVLKQQQRSTPLLSLQQHSSSAAADDIGGGTADDFNRLLRSRGAAVASDDGVCAEGRLSPVRAETDDYAAFAVSADQSLYRPPCGAAETPRQLPSLENATASGDTLPASTALAEFAADKSGGDSAMAGAMDDYGASLDKLSSSITELQFELARLALKQKHMEDAAAAAAAVTAAAPSDGGRVAPVAFPASSRHATYALSSQIVASSFNNLAAAAVNGSFASADPDVWHSSDTAVPAFAAASPAVLNHAAAGSAAAAADPVCSSSVHRDSKPFRLAGSSASASQAPKASSRHGTVVLSAAAAPQAAENSWPISGPSRGGSAPPSANGSAAPTTSTGEPPAAGSAAVRSGGDGGAFFVPVQATDPSSSQRRSSADAAAAAATAGKLPTTHVKHPSGKRATWCVTTPGTDRAAIEPWLVAAIAPSPADETMPPDGGSGAVDVEGNLVVRPLDGSCDGSDEDMQRRRERIQQLEQRRLDDVQRRRRAKEVETERRREEVRAKELAAERKKAEERLRRELILQQYKERKAEDDPARAVASGDGGGRIIAAPLQARPRSSAARRSPANVNRHSSGAVLGGQLDSLLLPTARDQAAPSGAVTHRRSISPSMSASDIASLNGKHSKKVSVQHGPAADAVFGNSHGALQAAMGGSAYSQQQHRQLLRVSSPDPSAASSAVDGDPAGGAAALKLFVQPSFKSNRGIIINAISHCVLAGTVNTDVKNKVLEELARSDAKHFLILFRDSHLQYRGIYAYNLETEEVTKVSGQGPKVITEKMFERFYKYNSGSKSFSEVTSTKHLSVSIDAITIKDALWQKKPSAMVSTSKRGV